MSFDSQLSVDELVFWFFVAAWLIVLGLLLLVVLPRAFGRARRIVKRVSALVNSSPLPAQFAKAERDIDRIGLALERLPELRGRAQTAVEVIRTTPLVPPAIGDIIVRVKAEIRAFRRFRG